MNKTPYVVLTKEEHAPKAIYLDDKECAELMHLGWKEVSRGTKKECQDYIDDNYSNLNED